MKLSTTAFVDGAAIPPDYAFCKPDPKSHVTLSTNLNPDLKWADAPTGTESFAILCHDPDVPSKGDDVNKEGRSVPATLPRVDFFHWVLIDLPPADVRDCTRGAFERGYAARQGRTEGAGRRSSRDQRLQRLVRE